MTSVHVADDWDVGVREVKDTAALARRWQALEARSDCSFFQSWGWIDSWLATLGSETRALLLEVTHKGEPMALAVLGDRTLRRHGFVSSRALFVTETGDRMRDDLTAAEHNGLLTDRIKEPLALRACFDFFSKARAPWDELIVNGLAADRAPAYAEAAKTAGLRAVYLERLPFYYVDLEYLRRTGTEYLATLSANTRAQIRRAIRAYERRGPVEVCVARDRHEMREYFAELRRLHQRHWTKRGLPGAFPDEGAVAFHERLIDACAPLGQVQLLRVCAGSHPFAYLYGFVFRGTVHNYQAGLEYEEDARLKPGLVAHAMAVRHNVALGYRTYDLLMHEARYKRSLAGTQGQMVRLSIQRPRAKFSLEAGLRTVWRRLSGRVPGGAGHGGG